MSRSVYIAPLREADGPELLEAVEESRADMAEVHWAPLVTDDESARRAALALGDVGTYAIRHEPSGRFLGAVMLWRAAEPRAATLAFWVRSSAQGRGFGRAGAAALVSLGLSRLGFLTIVTDVATDDARSVALLRALGFEVLYPQGGRIVFHTNATIEARLGAQKVS